MARYEHLPIYKAALDLTVHLQKVVAGFSRYHKYTLGTELRERSRAVLQQVVRANNQGPQQDRAAALLHLRDDIEALLLALRVRWAAQRPPHAGVPVQRAPQQRRLPLPAEPATGAQ